MKKIMEFALTLLGIYLVILLLLYVFQRSVMYFPDTALAPPETYGLSADSVSLTTADNLTLTAWYIPAKDNNPTIVYFHGKGGHLGYRAEKFHAFANAGFGVFATSYRGYGTSEGSPSEQGLYADARAAISHMLTTLTPENIILYGESLGTGVAAQMAMEHPNLRALVLEAPYTSVATRSQEIYPVFPAFWLVKDRYETLKKLPNIHLPILIFHGEKDRVIPIHHGRTLLKKANDPKHNVFYPDVDHTAFPFDDVATEIKRFLSSY
jgi:fermentation-respiration switch protein FrsA (DUF1100 family)